MEGTGDQRFIIIKRYFPIYLCTLVLILSALFGWNLGKDGIPKGTKYFQVIANNKVTLHVLKTDPSNISFSSINDNVVQSGISGINGGFFWENQLLSIAVMDGIPVNGSPEEYGSGWFNTKYARGTMVYDRVTKMVNVQRASSVVDLYMTDATRFWAQGGISMNLQDDSNWYRIAVKEEGLPFPDVERLRSGMAYDNDGKVYLVVTSTKCTAEEFRTAMKRMTDAGNLNEAIFLDGDGSSQLLADKVKLKGDSRAVVQMIVVNGE
ncbi:phosphodiester glycosidase family protein [Paenibacillus motobuensis]|uniref:Phosphodiester glycosidase family protein n=1 Tax=Paenibacillus motobuensis TaxID=295324 RepID=A0ABN0Y823_9BACL